MHLSPLPNKAHPVHLQQNPSCVAERFSLSLSRGPTADPIYHLRGERERKTDAYRTCAGGATVCPVMCVLYQCVCVCGT